MGTYRGPRGSLVALACLALPHLAGSPPIGARSSWWRNSVLITVFGDFCVGSLELILDFLAQCYVPLPMSSASRIWATGILLCPLLLPLLSAIMARSSVFCGPPDPIYQVHLACSILVTGTFCLLSLCSYTSEKHPRWRDAL